MQKKDFNWRDFGPMISAQITSVFIDYAFKALAILAAFSVMAQDSYANQAAFISLLAMAYTLPFIFLGGIAGYFSDRFKKRNVLIATKIAEFAFLIFACFTILNRQAWGVFPILLCILLLATQTVILSPAFNGLIPERFGENGASKANGFYQMFCSVAIIAGGASGFIFVSFLSFEHATMLLLPISFLGLICGFFLRNIGRAHLKTTLSLNFLYLQFVELYRFTRSKTLFLMMLGDAFFCAVSTIVLSIVILFCTYTMNILPSDSLSLGLAQVPLGLGVGLGSYISGRISGKHIELGLVFYGLLLMIIGLLLIPLFPGVTISFMGLNFSILLLIWLFILGWGGGVMIVPIRTYLQCRSEESIRGKVIASSNILAFGAMFICSGIVFYLTSGVDAGSSGIGDNMIQLIQEHCLTIDVAPLFYLLALCSTIVLIFNFFAVPERILRLLALFITQMLFKLARTGKGEIPEQGACLIVSNHVSFFDGFLIAFLTHRNVRFMLHEDYFKHPLIRPFARFGNMIKVPEHLNKESFQILLKEVKNRLENHEVICLFPEGKLTRNGVINEFRPGFMHFLKETPHIPIIPVYLGRLFGRFLTRSLPGGAIRFNFNSSLRRSILLVVGAPLFLQKIDPFSLREKIAELGADAHKIPDPIERTIHYRIAKNIKAHPFRTRLFDPDGKSIQNYRYFVGATCLANKIKQLEKSHYVAILLPNSIAASLTIYATLLADKTPAILNFTASEQSNNVSLSHIKNPIIITSKKLMEKLKNPPQGNFIFLEDLANEITPLTKFIYTLKFFIYPIRRLTQSLAPKTSRNLNSVAVILYSSGSSGVPKAVQLTHHNLNTNADALTEMMGLNEKDSFMGSLPLFHSYGFMTHFYIPMSHNAKTVFVHSPLEASQIGELVKQHALTILLTTPTFLQNYYKKCSADMFKSLRIVIAGGEKLNVKFITQFYEKYGIYPIEGYGTTELAPVATINIRESIPIRGDKPGRLGSIGLPLPGIAIKIAHVDDLHTLSANEEGLIMVKGGNLMKGYLNESERTTSVIIDGWYNTQDMGYMTHDGYVFITGRLSRFSKIGGEIVPHERIEQILIDAAGEKQLRSVVVSACPDLTRGERLIVLYTNEFYVDPLKAITLLRQANLPNLWIPKIKDFYKIDSIPVLGSGKLDLFAVKNMANKVGEENQ